MEAHTDTRIRRAVRAVGGLVAILLITAPTQAGSPSLGSILPRGGRRGTELVVNFQGDRLNKALSVLIYRPGIEVKKIEQVNDKHVKCTLAIAKEADTGLYPMRMVTATGITQLRLFSVGNCPEAAEKESNNDQAKPQPITFPTTINGQITNEDVDFFSFSAKAGQRINFEIEAMRLGDTVFDPTLELTDPRGAVLAGTDDTPLVRQDAVITHTFEKDGTYLVKIREASYRGNGASRYRLHIGEFPRPQGVFPPGGMPGQELEVQWLGDKKLGKEKITLPKIEPTEFGVYARSEAGICPSPVPFRLNSLEQCLEAEPNNDQDHASPGKAPGAFSGILNHPGDVDWYKFPAKKGQKFNVRLYGRSIRSPIDSVMGLHKLKGARIANNDDSGGPDSAFGFTAPEDGEYALFVHDLLRRGGELFTYRVEITPVKPVLRLSTPKNQQHVAVPRGNRNAIIVNTSRSNFGGPLNLSLAGMPEGMTLHAAQVPGNVSAIPIVLEAKADAKPAGALADLIGKHADEKKNITGHLQQSIQLTRYRNENETMCEQLVERLPVSVSEVAPFSIEIVQPKVPLVRRGQMSLKIIAKRAEGYKADIKLRVLWNPPGVGSGTAVLKGDQTEVTLHLNANNGAALAEWPLVVLGTGDVGGGVQVSSQLAKLTIAEAFVDFAIDQTRITQGQSGTLPVKATKKVDFEGEARVRLAGLPGQIKVREQKITKDTKELAFALEVPKDAPAGRHGGMFVHTTIMLNGEPIAFSSGRALLIVDKPLPPKKNEPPKPKKKVAPKKEEKKKRERERRDRGNTP